MDSWFLMAYYLSRLRYYRHAGDEIAVITTVPLLVIEITHNYKGYDVPCLKRSCLKNLSILPDAYDCHLLIICLLSYSTEVV